MLREIFTSQRQFINYFFDHVDLEGAESVLREFLACKGMLIFTGVGKSGIIADKLVKTMISTGTRAIYLPPTNAIHGDIGMVGEEDLVILISKSGQSKELEGLAYILKRRGVKTMSWVSTPNSPLSKLCHYNIELPFEREICPFDLAPTTSTAVQLIFGDIIAVALMKAKKFSIDQYAMNHPGGAIGKLISEKVADVMVCGEDLPICKKEDLLKDVLVKLSQKKLGCLLALNGEHELEGVFTDGDLRRALEENGDKALTLTVEDVMTKTFLFVSPSTLTSKALDLMEGEKKITMLPVLDGEKLVGLIHIHHILTAYTP